MSGILNISKGSTMALHAAMLLSKNTDGPVTTIAAAQTLRVSAAHLSKVFQRMTKAGIVRAVRGPKGGYLLNKPLGDIRLLDVFESIEGPLHLSNCLMKERRCGVDGCMLGDMLDSINKQVVRHFEKRLSQL